jgi:hypothetical protein
MCCVESLKLVEGLMSQPHEAMLKMSSSTSSIASRALRFIGVYGTQLLHRFQCTDFERPYFGPD